MRTILLAALLLAPVAALPGASAAHECDYYYLHAAGIETYACLDDQMRPHSFIIKDESLGGVMGHHPLFTEHEWLGGDFESFSLVVWTYGGTPTGQSWVHPFYWCTDTDHDGDCDDNWFGASTYYRGWFTQVHLDRRGADDPWYYCALTAAGWYCGPLVATPGVAIPTLPRL